MRKMRNPKGIAAAIAVATAAGLTVGLTGSVQAAPDVAAAPKLSWASCGNDQALQGLQCATVQVPMDYARPNGKKIGIAISRHKATNQNQRHGVLLTNPGGPGGDGLALPNAYKDLRMARFYDIIGMDPRGVGRSAPLSCGTIQDTGDLHSRSRPTDAQFDEYAQAAKRDEAACEKGGGDYRQFVTTRNTAQDMDRIRVALGEKKINYLGVSYGTWLGAVYGQLFPGNLDRSVLDSAVDPTKTWYDQTLDNNESKEFNFGQWAKWVAARNDSFGLGTSADSIRKAIDRISAKVAEKPGFAGIKNRNVYDESVGAETRYRTNWAAFALLTRRTAKALDTGTADNDLKQQNEKTDAAVEKEQQADEQASTVDAAYNALTCDWQWSTSMDTYYGHMKEWRDRFPYGETTVAMEPTVCAFNPNEGKPDIKVQARKYPKGVVLNSDGDPQTSLISAQHMATLLDEPLITVHNEGVHGLYGMNDTSEESGYRPNPCVDNQVDDYFINGTLPAKTDCDTSNPPAYIPADQNGITTGPEQPGRSGR